MDKQMIEEMAKEINRILFEDCLLNIGGSCADCEWNGKETKEYDCQSYLVAKKLLEKYQPKIPENAVVLTGMETEQRFEDLMVAFDEMGFMPNTTHPFPEEYVETWKQRLIFVFGQLRKETAEKFAELAKAKLNEWLKDNEDNDGKIDFGIAEIELIGVKSLEGEVISESLIDEIAKEITGGEKEISNETV